MAKNKLLRWSRIYVDGYNLSGDSRTISALDMTEGDVDVSGWSEIVRHHLRDYNMAVGILGYQAILNDTTATGAFTVLKTPVSCDVAFLIGSGAAPVAGDQAYLMKAEQLMDNASFDSKLGVFQADFKPLTAWAYKPMGVVLSPETSVADTTEGASVNNGAGTTNGWIMQMHITATSSGDYAFKIEQSANNVDWTDLSAGTFTVDGSAIASETVAAATGTVAQYIRLNSAKTSGACTPVCVFSRN